MASIISRPRADGSTAYKVQWRLGGGREGPWQCETFDDRRAAAKFQRQVEACDHLWPEGWVKGRGFPAAVPEGVPGDLGVHPFVAFGHAYVRRLTSAGPQCQTRYLQQVTALGAWLRAVKGYEPTLQNLTPDDDRDWINLRRRAGASPKTIANYHGLLAAICQSAVAKGLIARNPCEGVKLPRADDSAKDRENVFLSETEFGVLQGAMHADSRDLLLVAVGTGLRWGELTALTPGDLELDAKVPMLTVRRAWKLNGKGEFAIAGAGRFYLGPPKTRESRRRVSLSSSVVDVLRRVCEGKDVDELVFPGRDGGRLDQGNWYDARWQRAVRDARNLGLTKSPRFHDLRHTHAAWLISAGVPLPVIQQRLGHKSIQITVDVYGGLLVETHEAADRAIDRALSGQRIIVSAAATSTDDARADGRSDDGQYGGDVEVERSGAFSRALSLVDSGPVPQR